MHNRQTDIYSDTDTDTETDLWGSVGNGNSPKLACVWQCGQIIITNNYINIVKHIAEHPQMDHNDKMNNQKINYLILLTKTLNSQTFLLQSN